MYAPRMIGINNGQKPGLAAFLTGDSLRYTLACQSIAKTQAPAGSTEFWLQSANIAGSINAAFEATLANPDLQWAWLMGDDHLYAPGIISELLERDVDVIVPLCASRLPPFKPVIRHSDGTPMEWHDLPSSGVFELPVGARVGDAGMLIRRRVLEALEPPWYDRNRSGAFSIDDQCFVDRLHREGHRVHIDLDNRLAHMGQFAVSPVKADGHWGVRLSVGGQPVADIIDRV